MQVAPMDGDAVAAVRQFLLERAQLLEARAVWRERIALDLSLIHISEPTRPY